ncbi:GGDEF domain-containing protein [Qipengyuania sphaerica]|uniref:GGDEF domain-containing protein n=1 Tax=Qipengyuania sphaerica TaxID=2867243 RepID=UPI001C872070|nr:GGDEF domain-containing protein [Qipengyuania sphaerica]MBX7541156.1 GGDEF domain-containing protein [Qipengyuania sphaerica]
MREREEGREMDWASATLGAFIASAFIFGGTALALLPIMRRRFLAWIVARVTAITIMVWALAEQLPVPDFISDTERLLIGVVATDLGFAFTGPMLASYLEKRVVARRERKLLGLMLPMSLVPIALLPSIVFAGRLDWLHDTILLGMLGMLCWGIAGTIREGSRAAIFQAFAWAPALAVAIAALLHELIVGGMIPHYFAAMMGALVIEFIITAMGVVDGFMGIKGERDRALKDMREAKLATALDPLTNIANRRGLEQHFNGKQRRRPTGLALVDCDHFKRINDQFGHDVGDSVLCAVARSLDSENLFAARLGGEEFVLLLYGENWQEAAEIARRGITQGVRNAVPELPYPITASAGLAALEENDTLGSVMKRADRALYAAKEAGRNRSLSLTEFRPGASLKSA